MTEILDAALGYAARGWLGFPLAERSKMPKIPKTAGGQGFKDATTEPDIIRTWVRRWPNINWGIRTGAASGLLVVDVDPRHGGDRSLQALEHRHGSLPPTLTCRTASGGRHLYFEWPGGEMRCSASDLGEGLDIRAEGGYVVAPPSRLQHGTYSWTDAATPPAAMPSWLIERLRKKRPAPMVPIPTAAFAHVAGDVLTDKAMSVMTAPAGHRNHALNAAAYYLGRIVGAGVLDRGHVESVLTEAATRAGLDAGETANTIRSGLEAGMNASRAVPA